MPWVCFCEKTTSVFNSSGSVKPFLACTLVGVQCLVPVSSHPRDESVRSPCRHHSSFPLAPSPKTLNAPSPPVWGCDLPTPVSYRSRNPAHVSAPQSLPGCFRSREALPELTEPDPPSVTSLGETSLIHALPRKLNWLSVIYSAQLSAFSFLHVRLGRAMQNEENSYY